MPQPPHPPRIRHATAADLAALPAIERSAAEAFRGAGVGLSPDAPASSAEVWRPALRSGTLWVAVNEAGRVVGFLAARKINRVLHIDEMDVDFAHQRRGIGRALLEAAIGWSRNAGLNGNHPDDVPRSRLQPGILRRIGISSNSHRTNCRRGSRRSGRVKPATASIRSSVAPCRFGCGRAKARDGISFEGLHTLSPFVPAKAGTQSRTLGVCRPGCPPSRGRTEKGHSTHNGIRSCFAGPAERAAPGRRLVVLPCAKNEGNGAPSGALYQHATAGLACTTIAGATVAATNLAAWGVPRPLAKGRSPLGAPLAAFAAKAKPPPRRPVRASGTGAAPAAVLRAPRGAAVVPPGRSPAPPGCRACEARRAGPHPDQSLAASAIGGGWRAEIEAPRPHLRPQPSSDPLRLKTPLEAPLVERGWREDGREIGILSRNIFQYTGGARKGN